MRVSRPSSPDVLALGSEASRAARATGKRTRLGASGVGGWKRGPAWRNPYTNLRCRRTGFCRRGFPAGFTKRSRRWWAPNGVARVRRLNGISVTNPLESTLWSNLAGQVDSWFKTARDLF